MEPRKRRVVCETRVRICTPGSQVTNIKCLILNNNKSIPSPFLQRYALYEDGPTAQADRIDSRASSGNQKQIIINRSIPSEVRVITNRTSLSAKPRNATSCRAGPLLGINWVDSRLAAWMHGVSEKVPSRPILARLPENCRKSKRANPVSRAIFAKTSDEVLLRTPILRTST